MLSEFNSLLFYIFAFSGSAYLLGFIKENQSKKTFFYRFVVICALAIPIIVAGYRACGTDTISYMYKYVKIIDTPWSKILDFTNGIGEAGHKILTKILAYFSHIRIYFGCYAFLTVFLVYKVSLYIKNENVAMSMLIYYFVFFAFSLNGMRQYLAIAIIAFSFKYILKKSFSKYIVTVCFATLFHTSAIFTIPLYFLWTKKDRLLSWWIVAPILIVVGIAGLNLESILEYISFLDIESTAIQRYTTYTSLDEARNRDFYLNLLVLFITLLHYHRLKEVNNKNEFFIILMFIGTLLGVCGFVSPYAKRISLYFSIAEIWVLSDIPKCYKDHHSIWTARILIIAYAIARFTIIAYFLEQSNLIPYFWILPGWAQV